MNRGILADSATQSNGIVTVTTKVGHGLTPGSIIYVEDLEVSAWNGWQTVIAVPTNNSLTFSSSAPGSSSAGKLGVLVDDLSPALFAGADQDSRPGNPNVGRSRVFVVGRRRADVAVDGNRYTRALQTASRHHSTLTCGSQSFEQEFTTKTIPVGDTYNEGLPSDRSNPGEYSYPTIQWRNQRQTLIDPLTGIRSVRSTGPSGAPSTVQTFQTSVDAESAWQNPAAPLSNGGTATFSGPCSEKDCYLLLRADNLSISGGATYAADGNSLDWVAVTITNASINNGSCSGDDCKVVVCLTVNGVSCASAKRELALTSTPSTYTIGTKTVMDLWQDSGAPAVSRVDASKASGTVSYRAATGQVTWVSGNLFSVRWTAGSRITVAGAEYTIASVDSERQLTLSNGPTSDFSGNPYSANNFGVLIRKKTAATDRVSIGYTTFQYGMSSFPNWNSYSVNACGPAVTVNGVTGFNCFNDRELYWVAQDGSDFRDLGHIGTSWWDDARFPADMACGQSSSPSQFDPNNGDTWYCLDTAVHYDAAWLSILKVHYKGDHSNYTPGQILPDCGLNGGKTPCLEFTIMQPTKGQSISVIAPAFSPDYQASGFHAMYWLFGGISAEGDLMVFARAGNQDTIGWQFILTLGDGTPTGAGPGSMRVTAAGSSYRKAPLSWCVLHATSVPDAGWTMFNCNDMSYQGANQVYVMTLTSAHLTAATGGPGGLNACPANPLGVEGQVCTDLTVSGEPAKLADGSFLQNSQVGDLIKIDSEYLRIVAKPDSTHLTVQRGFGGAAAAHSGNVLTMTCGVLNPVGARNGLWNFKDDPYGANADFTTVVSDPGAVNGHGGSGPGVLINAGAAWYTIGQALCPSAFLGTNGTCYQVRLGNLGTMATAKTIAVADAPAFAGATGIGHPLQIDSHPGPCINGAWCLDARPFFGGSSPTATLGSTSNPFTKVTGQLWKVGGANAVLDLKHLPTLAYLGRRALVDISGPNSRIASDSSDSFKYCVALAAGECVENSVPGTAYVNAPYVGTTSCYQPPIAVPDDDRNSICIGSLGAELGNLLQVGIREQDLTGAHTRRLGTAFARWNQMGVYWNVQGTPNGSLMFSQVRWLEGVRHDDLITILPPYPAVDGVSRNTFLPVRVTIVPPENVAVDNAVVEFGYAENGDTDSFFCTSRQESCAAVSAAINTATPFYYAQTETFAGANCANGCTVTIPALPQHVVYYRWKYRDATGKVLAMSKTFVAALP